MNETIKKQLEELKTKYAYDAEAIEAIERAENDITYLEKKEEYSKIESHVNNLKAFLNDWH